MYRLTQQEMAGYLYYNYQDANVNTDVEMRELPGAKESPLPRVRLPMRPSVIRRICKLPRGHSQDKITDIVYTNSQFPFVECSRSKCKTCPIRRSKIKTSTFASGAEAALAKRKEMVKNKKQFKDARKPSQSKKKAVVKKPSSANLSDGLPYPNYYCPQINGQTYQPFNMTNSKKRKANLLSFLPMNL